MPAFPTPIRTKSLKLSDVPAESADLSVINRFALTIDPNENIPCGPELEDLTSLSTNNSVLELRARLFKEQRRWNHRCRRPDAATELEIRKLIGLIRAKLSGEGSSERVATLRRCIDAADPFSCLRATISDMVAAGVGKASIRADLYALRNELRESGNESGEDAVLDVMDRVVGWCSPHQRFF